MYSVSNSTPNFFNSSISSLNTWESLNRLNVPTTEQAKRLAQLESQQAGYTTKLSELGKLTSALDSLQSASTELQKIASQEVTVQKKNIVDFVNAYNELLMNMKALTQSAAKNGPLPGNNGLRTLEDKIGQIFSNNLVFQKGDPNQKDAVISFNNDSKDNIDHRSLEINRSKLDEIFSDKSGKSNESEKVIALFTNIASNLSKAFDNAEHNIKSSENALNRMAGETTSERAKLKIQIEKRRDSIFAAQSSIRLNLLKADVKSSIIAGWSNQQAINSYR